MLHQHTEHEQLLKAVEYANLNAKSFAQTPILTEGGSIKDKRTQKS